MLIPVQLLKTTRLANPIELNQCRLHGFALQGGPILSIKVGQFRVSNSMYIETREFYADEAFCRLHPRSKEGPYVQISFTDTGVGIQPELRERIFEPFFTTREVGKGTGLRLAIFYGIVKQHDGLIHVESKPGKGANFQIYLPAAQEEACLVDLNKSVAHPVSDAVEAEYPRILVAEDDGMVLDVVTLILGRAGYRLLVARNGYEVEHILTRERDRINLVLIDALILKMSDRTLVDRIRQECETVPVLLSVGSDLQEAEMESAFKGQFAVIDKPYEGRKLLNKVRKVLYSSRGKEEPA